MNKRPCQPLACTLAAGLVLVAPAARAEENRPAMHAYEDTTLTREDDRLVFQNAVLRLEFDAGTGAWTRLTHRRLPGNLLVPNGKPAIDAVVDGQEICAAGARLTRWEWGVEPDASGATLSLFIAPENGYELRCDVTLAPRAGRVLRRARLARRGGQGTARLEGFVFRLPGLAPGDPNDVVVDVPGPWWPNTYIRPGTPYGALAGRVVHPHGTPDGGFGFIALSNRAAGVTAATWMDTHGGETNAAPRLMGDGRRVSVEYVDARQYRLPPDGAAVSDVHVLELTQGLDAAMASYRAMAERTMPPNPATPAWVREAVILEVYPPFYPGGFRAITERLPFYRNVGFNVLYLMPHWTGGYSPKDLYAVDPAFGTPEELKRLVREAHRNGFRVLFDMVIHGFHEDSPVPQQRPELFLKGEHGTLSRHPTWRSITPDWANPMYQAYMADVARHHQKEYGIDGYRLDAASYKGPWWSPDNPRPAYKAGTASPAVMKAMLDALRETQPDAVILNEVFGPGFYPVSNLAHDNQTEALTDFLERLQDGRATAQDYKTHLASVQALAPRGANRVFFARNHDTSWFFRFDGYTPRFLALDAIHALCAIPEVFAGDPRNGPNPDDAVWSFYRRVFGARRRHPALARGDLLLGEVRSDNPMVFTAARRLGKQTVLVAVSLSDKPETVHITPPFGSAAPDALQDLGGRESVPGHDGTYRLQPFQVTIAPLSAVAGRQGG